MKTKEQKIQISVYAKAREKEYQAEYYQKNKDRIRVTANARYKRLKNDPDEMEKIRVIQREWRKKNKEHVKIRSKQYYDSHVEQINAARRVKAKDPVHKAKVAEYYKKYMADPEHQQRIKESNLRYRANNKKKLAAAQMAWRKKNPEKQKAIAERRKLKVLAMDLE